MKHRLTNSTDHTTEARVDEASQRRMETREFESVEDLMRFDAKNTPLPDGLKERILRSAGSEQKPAPWWKRWFA